MRYKNLFRTLGRLFDSVEDTAQPAQLLTQFLRRVVDDLRPELGLTGVRMYVRETDHYRLDWEYPSSRKHRGFEIPLTYEPIRQLLEERFILRELGDPGVDRALERALGVDFFAAICAGDECANIIAFSLAENAEREHVIYTLNTIRHVINMKLREQRMIDRVAQVREIQLSLLPRSMPSFDGFDIHGATLPAEEVGGDLYDFIPVSERSLGIGVVDSSGHGLPAALQARDAIIGLRMGVQEDLRITTTIAKLNRVIADSALASRFISLFYGEIDKNGTLVYCNAGHVPPLLYRDDEFRTLERGGRVLGPSPEAQYERGYIDLGVGSILLIYTDGISEAESPTGEMFGADRIRELVSDNDWDSAKLLVERVFSSVREFSRREMPVDDQTCVAVLRRD